MNKNINIPNLLTIVRLVFAPLLAILFLYDSVFSRYAVLVIVVICELTDVLDGHLARKYNCVTNLGKIIDPMTDSIYRDTIFISLAVIGQTHFLLVLPILYRDSIISSLRTLCAYRGIVVAARWSGKIKAIMQAIVIAIIVLLRIFAIYFPSIEENLYVITNWLMVAVCAATIFSAVDYINKFIPHLQDAD